MVKIRKDRRDEKKFRFYFLAYLFGRIFISFFFYILIIEWFKIFISMCSAKIAKIVFERGTIKNVSDREVFVFVVVNLMNDETRVKVTKIFRVWK